MSNRFLNDKKGQPSILPQREPVQTEDQHPVPATLEAFEKVFDAIKDLALIGQISNTEDEVLSLIVGQLHELHEQFGEREFIDAMKASGEPFDEDDKALQRRLQTRLVMQADENRGSALSELAQSELLEHLSVEDEEAN